jgi:hypothetical protein
MVEVQAREESDRASDQEYAERDDAHVAKVKEICDHHITFEP